ncbi:ABC transporter substrate-binding protein [Streptomyces sp. NPDC005134]|uniref:ABC transporter substrate-binding protein n=1 Tax=Streptomyces sp. NPDC005098 TaxID=3154560 RepID=UPI0033BC88DF
MNVRIPRRAAAALAALALPILALPAPAAQADGAGTTLRVTMDTSGVDTLNPFLAYFDGALDIFGQVYPSLNSLRPDGSATPYLADSWTTSADKLSWTFKIHKGLKWSDGQPITAEDAAWTLNLIMTNETAATANGSLVRNFAKVEATDANTLVITTKDPQSNMLYVSTPSSIPIVPKHIWEKHTGDLKSFKNNSFPLVGYGPWKLATYKTEQYAKLDANKDFFLGAPKFDHLLQQQYKTTDAAVAALRSGQLDYVTKMNSTQFKALRSEKNVKAFQTPGHHWSAIEINAGAKTRNEKAIGTANPVLADQAVRTAIAYATDKKTLVKKVLNNLGAPGVGYLPPAWSQWAWTPEPGEATDFDPAKANALLDEAGYKKGKDGIRTAPKSGNKLNLRLGIHSDSTGDAQISSYVKGWLKDIGIELTIQPFGMTKLNDNLAKGDWDMLMDSWGTGPDPSYMLGIQTCDTRPQDDGTSGSTDAFHCDKEYDKLFQEQIKAFDPAERARIVGQMQDILYRHNQDMILYYDNGLYAARTDTVKGLVSGKADAAGVMPTQLNFWSYAKAAPAAKSADSSMSTGTVAAGVGAVAVLGIVGGLAVRRRKAGAGDRE